MHAPLPCGFLPGAVTQGFDLPDARLMIASAMEDLAGSLLEEGKPLPSPVPIQQRLKPT
jgi:predicted RNase H-like HicB family nuclease